MTWADHVTKVQERQSKAQAAVDGNPQNMEYSGGSNGTIGTDKELPVKSDGVKSETETRCGCRQCRPAFLQVCAIPACYLVCICALVFIQSFAVSGYSSSILTTIEKRYNLWSSELGFIISSYDITSVIAGIGVSYFGDRYNRATVLSRAALLIALGCVGFSLPYFLGGIYTIDGYTNSTSGILDICNSTTGGMVDQCSAENDPNRQTWALAVFVISFMVVGVGASPVYTLGTTYLYDNVMPSRYPVYSGLMYSMGALGPAAGFLLGGALLEIYVHPGEQPPDVGPSHSEWIGAWWIGFLMTALLVVCISIPLAFFPRELPGREIHGNSDDKPTFASFGSRLKDFPKNVRKLLGNASWLMVTLVSLAEQSIGTGFNRFIAKYMQLAFNLPPTTANIITGCVLIPSAVLGIISGGVLMNKLRPSLQGTVKLMMALNCIPTIGLAAVFALGCNSISIVGVTDAYQPLPQPANLIYAEYKRNLTAECNVGCQCREDKYNPVCGSNERTYYSPCHAGCTELHKFTLPDGTEVKNYSSCACIYEEVIEVRSVASSGRCESGCPYMIPFLVVLFIVVYLTTCGHNPALILTLRCVDADTRSFALGIQNLFFQLLAYIPAPIYFGQIFDSQCILWTNTCGSSGACLEYDIHTLPYVLFGTALGLKVICLVFLFLTLLATRRLESRRSVFELKDGTTASATTASTVPEDAQAGNVATINIKYSSNGAQVPPPEPSGDHFF